MKNIKKNNLKFMSLILAAIMSVAVFASCSAKDPGVYPGYNNGMDNGQENPADPIYPAPDAAAPESDMDDYYGSEEYAPIIENDFIKVTDQPLSTFSADVDTASYSNLRRMINAGYKMNQINKNAVRTEEMLNYFKYDYKLPNENEPFGVTATISDCPWNPESKLAIFGFRTENIDYSSNDKPSNLVFLIDVSGSMRSDDKLPLLQQAFAGLAENLNENDRISIVTYSGQEKVVLKGAKGNETKKIVDAINGLKANGSTNGQSGLEMAYSLAQDYFIEGGNNRIIMASDGDLNVGIYTAEQLKKFVEEKRKSGIYLSVLGFGTGNYKDDRMEALADYGNGNYFYIDSIEEAEKVLGTDLNATINTIANDVKFQIDFNHDYIDSYRLIGYENRILNNNDFENDAKDAGEVGSGHMLTVAYELKMNGSEGEKNSDEWLTVSVRYKNPGEEHSNLLEYPITATSYTDKATDDFYFASAVIELAMVIRESKYCNGITLDSVLSILGDVELNDEHKAEFKSLVETLKTNSPAQSTGNGSRYE